MLSAVEDSHNVALHQSLLERVAQGDKQAFERLYDLFTNPLFAMAFRILNNREEAEEVIQDAFISIWKRAHTYDSELSRPFSWMILITRRLCWNKLRSRGRHQRKIAALGDTVGADVNPHPDPKPELSAEANETRENVERELKDFPELQQKCLEMAIFDGLTQAEIADQLGLPLGSVKTWIRRGMIKIKTKLGEMS